QTEQMKILKNIGLKVVEHISTNVLNIDELINYLVNRKENGEFEVDGIVVVDDGLYPHVAGNPANSFAFKAILSDQVADATIKQVIWDPSMDGYLKPKIEIYPINLGGTTITYATAFNAKYVVD